MMAMNITKFKLFLCDCTFSLLCAVKRQPVIVVFNAFPGIRIKHEIMQHTHIDMFKLLMNFCSPLGCKLIDSFLLKTSDLNV